MTKLMKLLAPHFTVNYLKDLDPKDRIPDEGHLVNYKKALEIFEDWMMSNDPGGCGSVVAHTDKAYKYSIIRTPPYTALLVAAGSVTEKAFNEMICSVPKEQEIIMHCMPSENIQEALYTAYVALAEAKEEVALAEAKTVVTDTFEMKTLSGEPLKLIDTFLTSYGAPSYGEILNFVRNAEEVADKADSRVLKAQKEARDAKSGMERQEAVLTSLRKELLAKDFTASPVVADGVVPNGSVTMKDIGEIFPGVTDKSFQIPVWEWDSPHPDVPQQDPDYIFREDLLIRVLYAIISKERMYLQGHTGSGKTTLIEQVASRLNWPFMRINFDSEITRMDLIGRDTLKDGASVFVDGVLPRMMQSPCIGVFDEIDFCRPDVAYVMQSALEGSNLCLTEDGGRPVKPHPMFRMFATGNTVGQGDEFGMYQGARPQSLAFLDRFTIWAKVPYLKELERKELLNRKVPGLSDAEVTIINQYATEHLAAFESSKVLQPISPRGILAVGKALLYLNTVSKDKDNIKKAMYMVVLDRASNSDHAVLIGLIDRVVK